MAYLIEDDGGTTSSAYRFVERTLSRVRG